MYFFGVLYVYFKLHDIFKHKYELSGPAGRVGQTICEAFWQNRAELFKGQN